LPEVVLLENVKGLAYDNKDEGLQLLKNELTRINKEQKTSYQPSVIVLNAAEYGVPQMRERVFVIAHREGTVFEAPPKTHAPPDVLGESSLEPFLTAWDAIGDLDTETWDEDLNARGKWADLLPSVPEGENYQWHTTRMGGEPLFGWRTRFWSFLLKLAKNRPSWTIQAQPGPSTGPFHWKSRQLSNRELARLQTFPDDYEFVGERRSVQRQIGNAVPPAIGELLGREIRRQLLGGCSQQTISLLPERRNDCPGPEPIATVPKKFLQRRGLHKAHPGKGKGPGAQRRVQEEQPHV
jgi:DNA (cytosine-5)-methyltransferase 1